MPSQGPKNKLHFAWFLTWFGSLLMTLGGIAVAIILWPVLQVEIDYQQQISTSNPLPPLTPANTEFSLVIPKIRATAPIIQDVDPFTPRIYQQALSQGIAHAHGSGLPGQENNTFLFAHSSADLGLATRYNSVFYLLNKLETQDQLSVWYQDQEYFYEIKSKQFVNPEQVNYLAKGNQAMLTLMTCWPPGTTLKRLIVTALPIR